MDPQPSFNPKIENKDADMAQIEEVVSQKIELYKKLPIISKAFELLEKLPTTLLYHNKAHTKDVLHETILFGVLDGLNEKELERLAVAASWHDVGFIERPTENEEIAIRLFDEATKDAPTPYTEDVKKIILDTTVRETEKGLEIKMSDPISAHLLDGDVSNFGREDFWKKRREIADERGVNWENKIDRRNFLESTLSFLKNHDWHTEGARKHRQAQKEKNVAELEEEIASLY